VPCLIPVSKKFMLLFFRASQTCCGFKFVARSISSTFSFCIIFLTHPPTYLISLFEENLFIESKIFFADVCFNKSLKPLAI